MTLDISKYSPLARPARKMRDVSDQPYPARRVVLHITGLSTYLNAAKAKVPPLSRIEWYFTQEGNPFAHYVIDPWGHILQIAEEDEKPWAQGWGAFGGKTGLARALKMGQLEVPAWWTQYWHMQSDSDHSFRTPLDLLFPGDNSPNNRAIAIEFIQYAGRYLLTAAQYGAGHMLIRDIALRHGITLPAGGPSMELLGHEDCNPWERGTAEGGWDPGAQRDKPRFCWQTMCRLACGDTDAGRSCRMIIPTPTIPDWAK